MTTHRATAAGLQANPVMLPGSASTSVSWLGARQGSAALRAAALRAPLTRSMPYRTDPVPREVGKTNDSAC